jgi:phospholipid/cholesterol/gamma-HCH transport system ATP-binding protein
MVFQAGALFDSMSVHDNIAFPLRERGAHGEEEIRRIVEERLEWVDLAGQGDRPPSELSGGMRRRVALARTLAADPEFILYDEPTTGLDPLTARKMSDLMHNLDRKLRSTSVLVTHDIACARRVSARWAYLYEGRVVIDAAPEDVLSSGLPEVEEFFLLPREV